MVASKPLPDVAGLIRQARAQLARGQVVAAAAMLEQTLEREPACVEANVLRGLLYVGEQRYDHALPYLRRAVDTDPNDGNAWMLVGAALFETGDREGAIGALERACELAPRLATAWYNLGRTYKLVGRFDDARRALVRALDLDPGNIKANLTMADLEVTVGRIDAGVAQYHTALRYEPSAARAWFGLANLKVYAFSAEEAAHLQRVTAAAHASAQASAEALILLGFALAKALSDRGDYAAAWGTLREANAREHQRHGWDRHQYRENVEHLMSAFDIISAPNCTGVRGREIIFIVSLPRSGSTLVEQILASHPDVAGGNETTVLRDIVAAESARRGVELANWAGVATSSDWARLGSEYLERTASHRGGRQRFTDKSLGTWELVGVVRRMLPGARVVHCHRDPLETCFSCYRQLFAQGCRFSNDLDDLVSYYVGYRRLMQFWQARSPVALLDLSYEALVAKPEPVIRNLLAFCGLDYDAACLEPERTERPVASTASAAQVRRPIQRGTPKAQAYGDALDPLRERLRAHGLV